MNLSHRVSHIQPSPTLAVAAKATRLASEGRSIINLGVGEPDFDTPLFIKQAAIDAIEQGLTKYTAVDGVAELKQAIAKKLKRENQLDYETSSILVSVGGKQSCYNLCQSLLNPGDEVLIPAPYWVSYPDMAQLAEAIPVILPTTFAQHYKITPEQLERAITPKTKLLWLNSPSNPSGIAYTPAELQALADVLMHYPHVFIASDDMYEHILWSQDFCNILNVAPSLVDRTLVLNGVSKAYAMTGWRIGYAAGPQHLIQAMKTIQSQSTSNPCSIAQYAAIAALSGPQDAVHQMNTVFQQRHKMLFHALTSIPGLRCLPADGTFYLFPDVQWFIEHHGFQNDLHFSDSLLEKTGLAVVPGSAFGIAGSIRLSFAVHESQLLEAAQRLTDFLQTPFR